MSFLSPSDMVEEDAADLQFPKDNDIVNVKSNENTRQIIKYYDMKKQNNELNFIKICNTCKNTMREPYIKCADCCCEICLKCFSKGVETNYHSNVHSYIIIHDNIIVFPQSDWTASEEKKFLNLIQLNGFGNWDDISEGMITRNSNECREHYFTCYFDGVFKKILGLTNDAYYPNIIPYCYKMHSVEPPRYDIDSIHFKNMSGYRAARGDFDIPYDNSAESIFNELNLNIFDNDNDNDWLKKHKYIYDELNCALFMTYNNRLRERHRRYKIMREHGLITINKNRAFLQKYAEALQPPQNLNKFNGSVGRFVAFMQITTGIGFDYLIESLQLYIDYKKYIFKLYDLRKNGITTFYGGKMYHKLKNQRIFKAKNRKEQLENLIDLKTLGIENLSNNDVIPTPLQFVQKRRKAAPLDIIEMPGYDQLTDDERNLCSKARITPMAYQEYKEIFKRENIKNGFLRLADARRLIKIDVNKTRQIYDFLIEHGYINKQPYA